jgi:putative addiction module component (TIGR02574 family)
MSPAFEQLKSQLGRLSQEERAELAVFLLDSLGREEEDKEVSAAWEEEIGRRVADIRSGKAEGKPAEQVFAELREQYR